MMPFATFRMAPQHAAAYLLPDGVHGSSFELSVAGWPIDTPSSRAATPGRSRLSIVTRRPDATAASNARQPAALSSEKPDYARSSVWKRGLPGSAGFQPAVGKSGSKWGPDYPQFSSGLRHDGPSASWERGLPARGKLAKAALRAPLAGWKPPIPGRPRPW